MKHLIYWLVVFLALGASIGVLTQCELILGMNSRANVVIDLGTDAEGRAIGPPPGVISYHVHVSGPNMTPVSYHVSAGARYINMTVPSGPDRVFRFDANLDPAVTALNNREHLLSYADEQVVDLSPGKVALLRFSMREGEMKLVVPNPVGSTMLYRIPNMHPTSYTDPAQFDSVSRTPMDIDYDGSGRIFVLEGNSVYIYGDINSIPQTYNLAATPYLLTLPGFVTNSCNGTAPSIAVDRETDRFYVYANIDASGGNNWRLYYVRYIGAANDGSLAMPAGIPTNAPLIAAMEIDKGVFYLVGNVSLPRIYRYIPGISSTWATSTNLLNPRDIMIKGKYIYITNYPLNTNSLVPGDNIATIEVFDKDTLAFIASYGGARTTTPDDPVPGHFYGPWHFIAPSNKKIYVIDDKPGSVTTGRDRIIAFDDINTWENWETWKDNDLPSNPNFYYWWNC